MTVSVRITGSAELMRALQTAAAEVRDAASLAVMEAAAEGEALVKLKMQQGPHTGAIYKRGQLLHQASAPGQPPAPDTGALMGGVYHEREAELTATFGSRMAYAAYLEFGTRHMAPRPVWVPVAEELQKVFPRRLEAAVSGAIK